MMLYTIFLIKQNQEEKQTEQIGLIHNSLKEARKELKEHLDVSLHLQSSKQVEQVTENFKDRFHFFIGSEKRNIVISRYYKSKRKSIAMRNLAIEKLKDFSKPLS